MRIAPEESGKIQKEVVRGRGGKERKTERERRRGRTARITKRRERRHRKG